MTETRIATSAADLVNNLGVRIDGVSFFKISAEIREFDDESDVPEAPVQSDPSYALKLRYVDQQLGIRLATTLDLGMAEVVVDATVDYTVLEAAEIPEAVRLEFANEVGLMALLPYVRQAIADISQRVLGEVVLMPIIPRGELSFTPNEQVER